MMCNMSTTSDGPLSDEEFRELAVLLHRHASNDMDQFDLWRFSTEWGPMSVIVRMGLQPGVSEDAHVDLVPILAEQDPGSAG